MLRNYLTIAWRNILKHSIFSFINIFGLAVSLSVCLLSIMLIKDSHSYDLFHPEADRVYRVITNPVRKSGGEEPYASSPYIVGKTLAENNPQVELWTPLIKRFNCDILQNNNRIEGRGFFTTATFFEMFGFELESGDPSTVLEDPYSIVLTKALAEKLFREIDPVGQTLELPSYEQVFKVTGVLKPFPGKTHIEFDALSSLSTQIALEKQSGTNYTNNFLDYYSNYNYIRLNSATDKVSAMATLSSISRNQYKDLALETRDVGYNFSLQALEKITPGPHFSNNMGDALPEQILWFFSALSIIVILSACFNYTNLTIARSLTRAKEVGVRKVLGASKSQIFYQFISEALLIALLSLGLAFILLQLTIPAFNRIEVFAQLHVNFSMDLIAVLLFIGFAVFTGIIAGLLPSMALSRFSPLVIIQRFQNYRLFRRIGLRKVLVVAQFSVSLIFILLLTIAWKQVDYSIQKNFGSSYENMINLNMYDHSYEQLSTVFGQLPQVSSSSAISHLMGTWADSKVDVKVNRSAEPIEVRDYTIDHHYLNEFQIELVAGDNFPENSAQQEELFAIVNENFVEQFDLGNSKAAIGQSILIGDSTQVSIRGVVKDFLYKPLVYNIEPLLLRYNPANLSVMNLTISSSDLPGTIAALEKKWEQIDNQRKFEYSFYQETVEENYANVQALAGVVGYFGLLALIISSLGLLGMAIYSVETKAKEISIRKVIGASAVDLVRQLSKGYFLLLVIAVVIALPISFMIGQQLLQIFAYRITLDWLVFLPGVVLLLLIGSVIIGSQTIRAALANPITWLRKE